jgi:lipoprotein-anchoring transpeptidase ErfK/SrfK
MRAVSWVAGVNAVVLVAGLFVASTQTHDVALKVNITNAALGPARISFTAPASAPLATEGAQPAAAVTGSSGGSSGYAYVPAGPRLPDPPVPASTMLASPEGTIPTYTDANGTINGSIGTWWTYPLTLPVTMVLGDWLQVRRPDRPNGSVTWIKAEDAFVTYDPYYLVVDVGPELLHVFNAGQEIMTLPVGVGAPATPTPTGNFFVAVHEPSSGYEYGPLILDTSAHSNVIQSWDGRGDAIIAIHGPIDSYADSRIGTGYARVSNGCIRMHNSDLAKLAIIPTGTPLDIYS